MEGNIICGLVGCVGKIIHTHETAFKQLLIVDSLRGLHSTGIAAVNDKGELLVAKDAILPNYLLATQEAKDIFLKINRVLIGHNRFATKGAINKVNAHPYVFQNIVGAHNGTITNVNMLPTKHTFEVDSQALLSSIDEVGSNNVASKIHGAFALTWYDRKDNTMHLWRNYQRPLWMAYTAGKDVLFWASEKEMLEFILARNNIKHEGMIELPAHKEYVFTADGRANLAESLVVYDRAHYSPPASASYNGYKGGYNAYGKWRDGVDYDNDDWYGRKAGGHNQAKKHLALVHSKGSSETENLSQESSQTVTLLLSNLRKLSDQRLQASSQK